MSHDVKSNFRKNLRVIREGHIEEGWKDTSVVKDTKQFLKTTGKDVALAAVPFYSAGEEGSAAVQHFKKGNYGRAAIHGALSGLYGGIDAAALAFATPSAGGSEVVGTGAKLGLKGLVAGGKAIGKSILKRFTTKQGEKVAAAETGKVGVKAITGPSGSAPKALPAPEAPKALPPPSQSIKAPPPPKAPSRAQNGISAQPSQFKGAEPTPQPKSLSQIKQELPKPTKTKEAPTNIETMPMQKAGEPIPTNKSLTKIETKPKELVKIEPKTTTTVTKVEPKTKVETKPETKTKTKTKDKEGKKGKRPFIPPLGLGLPSVEQPKPLKPGDFGLKPTITNPQAVAGTKAAQSYELQSARQQAKIWNVKESFIQKLNEKKKDKEDDSEVPGPPPKPLKFGLKPKTHTAKTMIGSKAAQAHSLMKTRREAEQFVKEDELSADELARLIKQTKPGDFTLRDKINAQRGELKPVVGSKAGQSYEQQSARQQARIWNQKQKQQNESNLSIIKNIVENKIPNAELSFDDRSVTINNRIAKKLINIYESLNKENRKKVEQMLNEDIGSYKKLINFAIRQ